MAGLLVVSLVWSFAQVGKHLHQPGLEVEAIPLTVCKGIESGQGATSIGQYLSMLFNSEAYPARWECGYWTDFEGWFMILSDISIFTAYVSIPILLVIILYRRKKDVPFKKFIVLFALFILFCGMTHLLDAWIFWEPMYRLNGFVKFLTGVVSWVTVIALSQALPVAFTFRSPKEMQAEIDRRELAERQLELFIKYTPGAVAMTDKDLVCLVVSDKWLEQCKLGAEEIIGQHVKAGCPTLKFMSDFEVLSNKVFSGQTLSQNRDEFLNSAGEKEYVRWTARPWYTEGDEVGGMMLLTENMTEQVVSEKRLEEREQLLRNVFDSNAMGIALLDDESKAYLSNDEYSRLAGHAQKALEETPHHELLDEDHRDAFRKDFLRLKQDKIPSFDMDLKYLAGEKVSHAAVHVSLIKNPTHGGNYALVMAKDLTELREKEESFQRQSAELKTVYETMDEGFSIARIGVWDLNLETKVSTWSKVVYEIHEVPYGNSIKLEDGINFYHPDDRETISSAVNEAIQEGKPYDLELRLITKNNKEIWVRAIGHAFKENGKVKSLNGLFQDIDKRKRGELAMQDLNEQLEHQVDERTFQLRMTNKELEAFTYSVSHDLRAPLRAISGFSMALIEDEGDRLSDDGKAFLDRIIVNTEKMGNLIDTLLDLSRLSRISLERQSLNTIELVHAVVMGDPALAAANIQIGDLPDVFADQGLMERVLHNLLSNAVKYSSKNPESLVHVFGDGNDKGTTITVKDNGVGFDMDFADKLFEVFQRLHTDKEFEGTGVGLSICKRIVDMHDGTITYQSELGKGTIFTVFLPHQNKMSSHGEV